MSPDPFSTRPASESRSGTSRGSWAELTFRGYRLYGVGSTARGCAPSLREPPRRMRPTRRASPSATGAARRRARLAFQELHQGVFVGDAHVLALFLAALEDHHRGNAAHAVLLRHA